MNFNQVIRHIENKCIMPRKPTLGPIKNALKTLNIKPPENGKRVILIAGTNGKGSVAKTLENLLTSEGLKVGLFTSPHLKCTTERISINNNPIDKKYFTKCFKEIFKETKKLTHFETLTVMAAYIFFKKEKVDWAVFEVGLGGTKDATNAITHQTSVITTLGYDHEYALGNSLEKIAKNKFGIIKKNNLVISAKLPKILKKLKTKVCIKTNCTWKNIDRFSYKTTVKSFKLSTTLKMYGKNIPLNLHGKRGALNTALALTAFERLGFKLKNNVLKNVNWPGRMSELKINSPCKVFLSGDHNEQGIRSLLEILNYFTYKNLYFVVGVNKTKDPNKMLNPLMKQKNSNIILTSAKFMGRQDFNKCIVKNPYYKNPTTALRHAISKAKSKDLIVVTGSLYLVGDILVKDRL